MTIYCCCIVVNLMLNRGGGGGVHVNGLFSWPPWMYAKRSLHAALNSVDRDVDTTSVPWPWRMCLCARVPPAVPLCLALVMLAFMVFILSIKLPACTTTTTQTPLQASTSSILSRLRLHPVLSALSSHPVESSLYSQLTTLIIIPGHTTLKNTASLTVDTLSVPANWFLLEHQRLQLPVFLRHISVGVSALRVDPRSLLLFSGSDTLCCRTAL